jgi:nucleoside-diphosphate-sugar epimerase
MQKINLIGKKIFVTGGAGFIGSNLILELLRTVDPVHIVSIDNKNPYYDVALKNWRLKEIENEIAKHADSTFQFVLGDIADKSQIDSIFNEFKPDIVVNLAAQAGVRYSITNPDAYIQSNIIGFYNIL